MTDIFTRPELTTDDLIKAKKLAISLANVRGREGSAATIALLICENIRLTREINTHREKLGYELLPTYDWL
jgi:hypothetical protein